MTSIISSYSPTQPIETFKGIIFDMDNTILKSKIDFKRMRKTVYDLLIFHQMLPKGISWEDHTPSQIIELGRNHPDFSMVEGEIWRRVEEVEAEGMEGAALESGVTTILESLQKQNKFIAILTNNSYAAAIKALEQLSIKQQFHLIVGREQMEQLKPSPTGVRMIVERCSELREHEWVMVGDSWIDGMAAQQAGIRFIAYQSDPLIMSKKEVNPHGYIQHLSELEQWI